MEEEVLFSVINDVGMITLNRPATLNALTMNMINKLRDKFTRWLEDEEIKVIVIKGAGERAFCAGGDVRAVRQSLIEHKGTGLPDLAKHFFFEEYILNHQIHNCSKPYVAFIDRVCMGGGVGLSVHGSHRVATERTLLGMPETTIGLFPDVGGAWFLSRLPGAVGIYLALTGRPIGPADCLAYGIATHVVNSSDLEKIVSDIQHTQLSGDAYKKIDDVLNQYNVVPDKNALSNNNVEIDKYFSEGRVEDIVKNLEAADTVFASESLEALRSKSPTSLKVTLEQIKRGGKAKGFAETMIMEYRMSQRFALGHDFREGVRALLVDKDHNPKWEPSSLDGVSDELVESYFEPVEWGDLVIP